MTAFLAGLAGGLVAIFVFAIAVAFIIACELSKWND